MAKSAVLANNVGFAVVTEHALSCLGLSLCIDSQDGIQVGSPIVEC